MARIFNGGTQPLVPAGRWGEGVVMPGESIEVEDPESYGPPWTQDAEAEAALEETAAKSVAGKKSPPPADAADLHTKE